MSAMTFGFEQLQVWQDAMDLSVAVYEATKVFPKEAEYNLTAQLRRAAASVPVNIAEGKGRYQQNDFKHFLYIARGSLYETVNLLMLAQRFGYLKNGAYEPLLERSEGVLRKLSGLINSLKRK